MDSAVKCDHDFGFSRRIWFCGEQQRTDYGSLSFVLFLCWGFWSFNFVGFPSRVDCSVARRISAIIHWNASDSGNRSKNKQRNKNKNLPQILFGFVFAASEWVRWIVEFLWRLDEVVKGKNCLYKHARTQSERKQKEWILFEVHPQIWRQQQTNNKSTDVTNGAIIALRGRKRLHLSHFLQSTLLTIELPTITHNWKQMDDKRLLLRDSISHSSCPQSL